MKSRALKIHIKGIVQGVGFRPFVYRVAKEHDIKGWVNNSSDGVKIHAQGKKIDKFYSELLNSLPPLAKITSIKKDEVPAEVYSDFTIIESRESEERDVLISPDIAMCEDCLQEMSNPQDRRFSYPFINCTNCGPRYTIIHDRPYDREKTTMSDFQMCDKCREEYENPLDRRFHAQPVACANCGPKVDLLDRKGRKLAADNFGTEFLENGAIIAVKGLGGFHLVCDAYNHEAVKRLRDLKERGDKPFALMVRDLDTAKLEVTISEPEEELISSPAAPIVLVNRINNPATKLSSLVAPNLHNLGIMLPYTPLHHLLFNASYDFLVMTSANLSGQPLIYKNEEALESLADIADYFLVHDRDIYHPCDDSVMQVIDGKPVFLRRARGYVPTPFFFKNESQYSIAALGGEMKNSFCLSFADKAYMSQYIGDMHGFENLERFKQEFYSFQKVANIKPEKIVVDKHPEYATAKFAYELSLPIVSVQHHYAHLLSTAAEYGIEEPSLGIICDGTGYGEDGKIWGFEFLFGTSDYYVRKAHLQYLPLPGGDAAAKHPLRIAYAYLKEVLSPEDWQKAAFIWDRLTDYEKNIIDSQLKNQLQIFYTSSAGRLFDAVSALLGICENVTYEGQAAVELESRAVQWKSRIARYNEESKEVVSPLEGIKDQAVNELLEIVKLVNRQKTDASILNKNQERAKKDLYYFEYEKQANILLLQVKPLFAGIVKDLLNQKDIGEIAYKFHYSLAVCMLSTVILLKIYSKHVLLGGGVFHNKLLTEILTSLALELKIDLKYPQNLPAGDGGLALGQAVFGRHYFNKNKV